MAVVQVLPMLNSKRMEILSDTMSDVIFTAQTANKFCKNIIIHVNIFLLKDSIYFSVLWQTFYAKGLQ